MSTVVPPSTGPSSSEPDRNFEMLRWLLGDRCPALWVLIFLVVLLAFALAVVWVLAPHLGDVAGLLAGTGVAGTGVLGGAALVRRRRGRTNSMDEGEE